MANQFPHRKALAKAVKIVGGQSELGRLIDISQQRVWMYLNTSRSIPADVAIKIVKVVNEMAPKDKKMSIGEFIPALKEAA